MSLNRWEPLWGHWDKWWGLYYSLWLLKQLDEVAKGWPACLWAVVATALMVKEASKWALGQPTTVHTPQQVQAVLETKEDRGMAGGWGRDHPIQDPPP